MWKVSGCPQIVDAPAHQLGQLLLVNSNNFFLRNVIVFVLLQSTVLAVQSVLGERAGTADAARALAVAIVGRVGFASQLTQVSRLGEDVGDPLVAYVGRSTLGCSARERRHPLLLT